MVLNLLKWLSKWPTVTRIHEAVEKSERSFIAGGDHKMLQLLWERVWQFFKTLHTELLYDPSILHLGLYQGN